MRTLVNRATYLPDLALLALFMHAALLVLGLSGLAALGAYAALGQPQTGALSFAPIPTFLACLAGGAAAVNAFMTRVGTQRRAVIAERLTDRYGVNVRILKEEGYLEVDGQKVRGELLNGGWGSEPAAMRVYDERVLPAAA